jgi:CYTH domain-containing protein
MAVEIERKFIVIEHIWREHKKLLPEGEFFRQGYLSIDPEKTIRVRETSHQGFLTIKGKTDGLSRQEFEYKIPKEEAASLLDKFAFASLSKIRFRLMHAGNLWEVDEFLGENEGLILAEIELEDEQTSFEVPEWIGQEVSFDERYFNSNLIINPYIKWKKR